MANSVAEFVPKSPMVAATPLRSGSQIKQRWQVQLPDVGAGDAQFGGCRGVEHSYQRLDQIGEGTYGQVYLAKDMKTSELVALKKIRMDNEKEGFPITAIREIKLLKNLHHENVINLKEIVRSQTHKCNNFKGSIYMVFDYMDHDMTGLMERLGYKFTVPQIKCYMKQLLKGLAHCHHQGVLHRDLKAANLLINNEGGLKLADFGLARKFREGDKDSRFTNRVITLWYRPPELLLGSDHYGPEVDMWSVGCIFAELLTGKPLFPGKDETDQMEKISQIMGSPTEKNYPGVTRLPFHQHLKHRYREDRLRKHLLEKAPYLPEGSLDLLEKMLRLDPTKRISAEEAFRDNFFWLTDPKPCEPKDLPKFDSSHELDMKRKRQADKERHQGGGQHGHGQHGSDAKRARHGSYAGGPATAHSAYGHPAGQAPHGGFRPPVPSVAAGSGYHAGPVTNRGGPMGGRTGYAGGAVTGQRAYAAPVPVPMPAAAAGYGQQQGYAAGPAAPYGAAQHYPQAQAPPPAYAGQPPVYGGGYMQPGAQPAAYPGYTARRPPYAGSAPQPQTRMPPGPAPYPRTAPRGPPPPSSYGSSRSAPSWQKERR
ncbi:g10312 [Coccomyxa elongata]